MHLLREASIDRAVEVFPDAEEIFDRNMHVLEDMGMKGWRALDVGAHSQAAVVESVADDQFVAAATEEGKPA